MKKNNDLKLSFLCQIIIAFLLTATLSIAVTNSMITGDVFYVSEPVKSVYVPSQVQPEVIYPEIKPEYRLAQIDVFQFVISFFIATALMLFFLKKFKGKFFFEFFFSGAIIFGAQGPFGLFLSQLYAFLAAIVLVIFRFIYPRIWTQNIIIIIGISGVAASLGVNMNPIFVIIILVLLSLYDIIAVYKTRHMVNLFKGMAEKGAVLALIIPKSILLWKDKFTIIKNKNRNEFIFLGTGDIALPLFFAASAFSSGLDVSVAIIIGAVIGLVVDHIFFVTQKEKKAIPALPAIAFFAIAGYVVSFYL